MNSKMKRYFIAFMSLLCLGGVTSCAAKDINSPEDAIVDAYGDRQFRISFDSTNLENPIADMYYTAKNMPVLPTPSKVGYVFDGWYFDENFIDQCNIDDGDLLWKMKNVTLYAKWKVEEIVNNGQYDIEYEAHIIEDSISYGPRGEDYSFYRFDEDIIKHGTYIEKNDHGTFLRIQYDCRTRGPVLGGSDVDADNFSPQTYTISDPKQRIDNKLSIFDRTSTLQTLYYDISGLTLSDPILLYVQYYNWKDDMPEDQRRAATVTYTVEFNITRFIGFGAPFINANSRLEDGVYSLPTHYGKLDKSPSILDLFNPVTSYIKANKGRYTLYKPMSAYNNDFGEIQEEHFPLRTTGYAKEFAAFLVNRNLKVSDEEEKNLEGKYFIPDLFDAKEFIDVKVEFNHENGQYYYIFDLGNSLDKDIVLFGGSSGAMEEMFSFPYSYRRLILGYESMVRLADWSYKEPTGDRFAFKKTFTLYPGSNLDFAKSNTDYEHYHKYLNSIKYPNCFFSKDKNGKPVVYTSRVNIIPSNAGGYLEGQRNNYQFFEMSFEVFGYDPIRDGDLYSRDSVFTTTSQLCYSNSAETKNVIGKSYNVGDSVSLYDLYKEKVSSSNAKFEFEAYEVDKSLNINFNKKVNISTNFKFERNIAIVYKVDNKTYTNTSIVILAEKENAKVTMIDNNWELNAGNMFTTTNRYNIGDKIVVPNIQYIFYNEKHYTRELTKDDLPDSTKLTDFTRISFWGLEQGVYTSLNFLAGDKSDLIMHQEKVIAMMQFVNQFDEFQVYYCLFKGVSAGTYTVNDEFDNLVTSGDLKYDAGRRHAISYERYKTIDIYDETWVNNVPETMTLTIDDEGVKTSLPINFDFALIFTKKEKLSCYDLHDIYNLIKSEKYAVIYLYYRNDFGDQILYKAQFNFKVEGDGVSKFNIINGNSAFFINQKINVESPLLTSSNYKNLGYASLTVAQKVGNNYITDIYGKVENYDKKYMNELEFHESGIYLLTFTFDITYDENGHLLFPYHNSSDSYNRINFSISQEITIHERAIDIVMSFVTDINHPFNPESKELFGYKIETKGDMQYATKNVKANEKVKSLSSDAFMPTTSKLYKWSDKNNNKVALPGDYINQIHVKLSTLKPVIYASWDDGCQIRIFTDIDGAISEHTSVYLSKDSTTGRDYYNLNYTSIRTFELPKGYQIYAWRSDKNIFLQKIDVGGHDTYVKTNFHLGDIKSVLEIYENTSLTAILKKPTSIMYEAYDSKGNRLEFLNALKPEYKAFINDSYVDSVGRNKIKEVKEAQCSDLDLKLQYWSVYDSVTDSYLKCDLDTLILLEQYSVNRIIKLRAIFG